LFSNVQSYAGDPILSLMEKFQNDPRPTKVNLSIGLCYDDHADVVSFESVSRAQLAFCAEEAGPSHYLPMEGLEVYREHVQSLLFGSKHSAVLQGRVATIQTVGGSGALKVGADFLRDHFPRSPVWVSDPTWDNHRAIFAGAGLSVHDYPYFDRTCGKVDFEAMMRTVQTLPVGSILLLHPCCHNPTGADLTYDQWDVLVPVLEARRLIAFLDIAYQGLGDGMTQDSYAIRAMASAGVTCVISNSFSKTFSLYGERVGALSVVCDDSATAQRVLGQLKATVRRNYSSPPRFGAEIVAQVLSDPILYALWLQEVEAIRLRIVSMRQMLAALLTEALPERNFDFFVQQKGMFSFTGLSHSQVERLRDEFGVYLIGSGRMCMAGLNRTNLPSVAHALIEVWKA
jgi:aromatic-amino-acid transaminase